MKISIPDALKFFDTKSRRGIPSAVIGVIGEELNAYAFKHFLESQKDTEQVKILDIPITNGIKIKGKTKYLDKWIYLKKKDGMELMYQCEIKNWAANAIGAYPEVEIEANEEYLKKISLKNWGWQIKTQFQKEDQPTGVTKVLLKMKDPKDYENLKKEPIVLYWMPISNTGSLNPLFKINIKDIVNPNIETEFEELSIFSVSNYLRSLNKKEEKLDCDSKVLKERIDKINKICIEN